MKSQKGITLISLTIYIIALAIVMGVIAVISNFFYSNVNINNVKIDPMTQYVKFNSFFSDTVNHQNVKVLECKTDENGDSYIVFSNNVQYTFLKENKGIYCDKIKICKDVDECTFLYRISGGKNVVTVNLKIGSFENSIDYIIGY